MSDNTKVGWKPSMLIETPMVVNFLKVDGIAEVMPIEAFDDQTLRAVGAAWTERLVQIAASRRTT